MSRLPIENSRGVRNLSMQFGHGAQVQRLWRHVVSSPLPVVALSIFTVIFTVKVLDTSIGAGLRAIRPKVTFRDLSRSIDSKNDSPHRRCAPKPVQATSESASPSSALSHCLTSLFNSFFYRHDADGLVRCCVRTGRLQTASVSITSMKRSALNPSGYKVQAELLVSASRDWSAL